MSEPPADRPPLTGDELRRRRAEARARRRGLRLAALAGLVAVAGLAVGIALAATAGNPRHRTAGGFAQHKQDLVAAHHKNAPASRPVTITVEASGDLLIHSPVWEQALADGGGTHYNFAALFKQIRPYIRGVDLPLCHVETPMTPAPPTGYPIFNTPPALAQGIRQTGWKACSTAATHSLDQAETGVVDTIRALDENGIRHAGTYASAAAQRTPLILTVKGIKVAFLSYTELTNGIPSPHPWSVNRAENIPQILAEARRAHDDGARVEIINIHWGDEDVQAPSAFQIHLANVLTRSPYITAVVGQHVHIPQPIRKINGKFVVFGEGNLISNQTSACCPAASQDGLIALLTIVVDVHGARVTFVHYVPIWVQHPSFVVLPVGRGLRIDPADAADLRASYARTVAAAGRGPHLQPIPAHLP
ncbi:MAG: CapA family protein [Solirubrobacterales bacterium]|nr:CapA family protein [Solirubrobacterales bacterium]